MCCKILPWVRTTVTIMSGQRRNAVGATLRDSALTYAENRQATTLILDVSATSPGHYDPYDYEKWVRPFPRPSLTQLWDEHQSHSQFATLGAANPRTS